MRRDEEVIEEINTLWVPIYPYMVEHLLEASRVRQGEVLDLGPFAGGIAAAVLAAGAGFRAAVFDESDRVLRWARQQADRSGVGDRLETRRTRLEPIPASDECFDLVAVRGAFFFLTPALLREVGRVLRPEGFAWVGGGYGPRTPPSVIAPIAERSKVLNEAIGKRRVSAGEAERMVADAGLAASARVSTEGGLWIEVRG